MAEFARFKNAIVRKPAKNFADGLTSVQLGIPDYAKALKQHPEYCRTLEDCGLTLTVLPPDERYPDSTFVEDVAVLTDNAAILTRPGASSRSGEVIDIRSPLSPFFAILHEITPPGTVDGGDVCQAEEHFFIGLSQRTNQEGARQLARFLKLYGHTASTVDIRGINNILHLKSAIACLGDNHLVVWEEMSGLEPFRAFHRIAVPHEERYAANCVRVNDHVLLPAGFPTVQQSVERLGYRVLRLEMSEFEKMDGGLSCLSLRF